MTTIDADIEREIVERLEASEDKDDIIFDLCNRLNLGWKEVEAAVEHVHATNADDITLSQSPLLVALALVTFIGGVGLTGFSTYNLIGAYETFVVLQGNQAGAVGGFLVYLLGYGGAIFWELIFGAGMIVGSLTGMRDVWVAVFAKLGMFQNSE
jgi:hypothetical protein